MASTDNQDLVWHIKDKLTADIKKCFLKQFESTLCLFSSSAAQLYSNYQLVSCDTNNTISARPNPYTSHDKYCDITSEAIIPTGIRIIPSKLVKVDSEHDLAMVFVSKKTNEFVSLPLCKGFEKLEKKFGEGKFLPVIINSDFEFINKKIPTLHLHRVDLNKLEGLSLFQRSDLQLTIETKLNALIGREATSF